MKGKNWFWGIFLILAAIFAVGSQFNAFHVIGFWSIAATVLLAAIFIDSLVKLNFFGILAPVALLYAIYRSPLGWPNVSVWLLLLAVVLASTGLEMIFGHHRHWRWYDHCGHDWRGRHGDVESFVSNTEDIDGDNPVAKISFGSSSKYLHSGYMKSAQLSVSFGELDVYFDQVQLSPEGAEVFAECSFGEMKLFLPHGWQVTDHLRTSLGHVQDDIRREAPEPGAPRLTLTGSASFGNIEIHYI